MTDPRPPAAPDVETLVAEWKRLLAEATPGPWTAGVLNGTQWNVAVSASGAGMLAKCYARTTRGIDNPGTRMIRHREAAANAALLVWMRNHAEDIIAALETAR